jgi:NADH oxidase (H2O-forming)
MMKKICYHNIDGGFSPKPEVCMKSLQLTNDLWWIGSLDPDLRGFDIIMTTEFGTTYNSYVLKGSEKTAIIETAKLKTYDQYIAKLNEVVDVQDIDYIIMNHTEPDHAGSIAKLIQQNPKIIVVATQTALNFLKDIVNAEFNKLAVKENDTLSLGNKTLRFMILPNLHWPDTMYTYVEEDGVLFTCDSFGAHYCDERVLLSKIPDKTDYHSALKYYFDKILGPFPKFMLKALDRIQHLHINMIATGHGPVIDVGIPELQKEYRIWATHINPNRKKTVIIPYVSAYGYTKELAYKITEGIQAVGDIDVRLYNMEEAKVEAVLNEIYFADGLLLGTPTILGEALEPIWNLTSQMFAGIYGGKVASAFGSYGWSGEGVPHMMERLKQLRMKTSEGLSLKFKPNDEKLKTAFDWGYNIGLRVLGKPIVEEQSPKDEKTVAASDKLRAWKCIVCGEIILSAQRPEICPVCGAPAEAFIEIPYIETSFSSASHESVLILGNGGAAVNAAEAIRVRNKVCPIEIIGEEDQLAYNRPMLTKNFFADYKQDEFLLKTASWYKENNIKVTLNAKAVELNTETKEVKLESGEVRHYDKLVIATGSDCFVPSIKGVQRDNVVKIRHLKDVAKIKELLKTSKRALIVGGGILGLEAAWQMKKAGLEVVVLEMLPALMLRQLDETTSAKLRALAEAKGIEVQTSVKILEISGEGDKADGILLDDGRKFEGDLIIISAGIAANADIAKKAGITVNRAIVVSANMETNVKGVYAAGDCAEFEGRNWAIWPQAVDMGKIAGANAAGDTITYTPILPAVSIHALDTDLYAIGDCGKNAEKKYLSVEMNDASKPFYAKYFFTDDRFVGGVLFYDTTKNIFLNDALAKNMPYADFLKEESKH